MDVFDQFSPSPLLQLLLFRGVWAYRVGPGDLLLPTPYHVSFPTHLRRVSGLASSVVPRAGLQSSPEWWVGQDPPQLVRAQTKGGSRIRRTIGSVSALFTVWTVLVQRGFVGLISKVYSLDRSRTFPGTDRADLTTLLLVGIGLVSLPWSIGLASSVVLRGWSRILHKPFVIELDLNFSRESYA